MKFRVPARQAENSAGEAILPSITDARRRWPSPVAARLDQPAQPFNSAPRCCLLATLVVEKSPHVAKTRGTVLLNTLKSGMTGLARRHWSAAFTTCVGRHGPVTANDERPRFRSDHCCGLVGWLRAVASAGDRSVRTADLPPKRTDHGPESTVRLVSQTGVPRRYHPSSLPGTGSDYQPGVSQHTGDWHRRRGRRCSSHNDGSGVACGAVATGPRTLADSRSCAGWQ